MTEPIVKRSMTTAATPPIETDGAHGTTTVSEQ